MAHSFMVMELVFRLSLANHSDSESFLLVHALFSQDGCQWEGFWEVVGLVVSPFTSRTLLVGGGLLVPYSLPEPPVIKQLMQIVTMVPGQSGRFQSVCFPWQFCFSIPHGTPSFSPITTLSPSYSLWAMPLTHFSQQSHSLCSDNSVLLFENHWHGHQCW